MTLFQTVKANIFDNSKLYKAQIEAYRSVCNYYEQFPKGDREVLVVMPTGSGKTGLMSILPFGNCKGKVLLITPGKVVRRTVFEEFDSLLNPQHTFLYKQNVILRSKDLPKAYLYSGFKIDSEKEKEITIQKLQEADIIVTNVHRLNSGSEEANLMNLVGDKFFDMIIIDEAHHVAASMWQEALEYFKASKVIKLTATPFRSDKQEISNNVLDPIFEYSLGEAIKDGLLKDVIKEVEIPGEVEFIHNETGERLTLQEAKQKLSNDWIQKSIALSEMCSKQIIQQTKDVLIEKRKSYPKHRVLAITCNDEHAQMICKWFNDVGLAASYVSTNSNNERENDIRLTDFANGKYDVMVSIQMLGEGYNNPDISIISIFRPFKTLTPYAQAIGRGLRKIHNANTELDNFCNVVYHKELGLDKLWEYYKQQKTYVEIIQSQKNFIAEQLNWLDELGFVESRPIRKKNPNPKEDFGDVIIIEPQYIGSVTKYSSKGIGEGDAFTEDGLERYQEARQKTATDAVLKMNEETERIHQLVANDFISQQEADLLIDAKEREAQYSIVQLHQDKGTDYLKAEGYRKDFVAWQNLKIEEFFSQTNLDKKAYDLALNRDYKLDSNRINNIGWISRNINQAIYQKLKKRIGEYNTTDYALAKKIVIEILEFHSNEF